MGMCEITAYGDWDYIILLFFFFVLSRRSRYTSDSVKSERISISVEEVLKAYQSYYNGQAEKKASTVKKSL